MYKSIPAQPLHNHDIVSVHFNNFPCTGICDKLSRHLSMLTYTYRNVNECSLTSSVPQQRFKLQISLYYGKLKLNMVSWSVLMLNVALTWSWSILLYWHLISIKNDRHLLHAWLDKDYSSPGMKRKLGYNMITNNTDTIYWNKYLN